MKRIIIFFLSTILTGYSLHQTHRITATLADGWDAITNYTIGVMGVLPFFCWLLKLLGFTNEQIARISTAYLSVFVIFGVGVSWARLNDRQSDTEEKP